MTRLTDGIPLDIIVAAAGAAYGVTYPEMVGARRNEPVLTARMLAYWLARRMTTAGLLDIGRATGRDHTSVHSGQRRAEHLRATNAEFALVSDTVLATLMRLESAGLLAVSRSCDAPTIAQRILSNPHREAPRVTVHEIVALALAVAATTPTPPAIEKDHENE